MIPNVNFKSIGQFTSQGEWIHPESTRLSWEFIYMCEGEGYFSVGNERIDASVGDMVIFPAGIPHGGYKVSQKRVSFIWMHLFALDGASVDFLSELPLVLRSVDSTQLPLTLRQLLHRASHTAYPSEMNDVTAALVAMEYSVWADFCGAGGGNAPLVNRVKEWIRINSEKPLSVSEVARAFSYNEDYLTRYFVKKTGVSLKKYIDQSRMNLLRTRLMTTDMTLKSIAAEGGFEDYKGFLKFFCYHEGISPTEFRKSCYMTRTNNK